MAFTYTFYTYKGKKNKKLKKVLAKKLKHEWSSHVTGKRSVSINRKIIMSNNEAKKVFQN